MVPTIHFCRLDLLIILNKIYPKYMKFIIYDFLTIFYMKLTCKQQFIIRYNSLHLLYICTTFLKIDAQ